MKNLNILDTVGNTPLLKIEGVYVKLETTNPSGSVKDRMVWYMIKKAEKRGDLKPGMKIIEVTSGNTGIALAMISAIKGYEFIAVMPKTRNCAKKRIMESLGAKVILTPAKENMIGAIKRYKKLVIKSKRVWLPKQFENIDNVSAHREGLGKEIVKSTRGKIDAFVTGAGTGGTIIGVSQALKRNKRNTKIIVIEPTESKVLSGGRVGLHKIRGIGEGFIPEILKKNINLIDEVITVKSADAITTAKRLAKYHGLLVGTSSGANMWAAEQIKKRYKTVVTIFPDRGNW
ncbi:MAG: cysteine synthase family protein [Patescibacteria group bacterium]